MEQCIIPSLQIVAHAEKAHTKEKARRTTPSHALLAI